jgi:hypothetical protein
MGRWGKENRGIGRWGDREKKIGIGRSGDREKREKNRESADNGQNRRTG